MLDQREPACLVLADISSHTLVRAYGDGLATLAPMIEADVAERSARAVPEPDLPASAGRNLTART